MNTHYARFLIFFSTILSIVAKTTAQTEIQYPSLDGLLITADYYDHQDPKGLIVLFHQANSSRGEYREIAPKLNALGYACMAVDQRSGDSMNQIENKTNRRAKAQNININYIDAYQDLEASVAYARNTYSPKQLIIWGSSYSSALVLKLAGDKPSIADAVLAFSPGEYFGRREYIRSSAHQITIPVFITSSSTEEKQWESIYEVIPSKTKTSFLPKTTGNHGSRALFEKYRDSGSYWSAVIDFLNKHN